MKLGTLPSLRTLPSPLVSLLFPPPETGEFQITEWSDGNPAHRIFVDALHTGDTVQMKDGEQEFSIKITAVIKHVTFLPDTLSATIKFALSDPGSIAAKCPDGTNCQREKDWGHPCDRDEVGNYQCDKQR